MTNAFIWEADSGLVDTSVFKRYAESPFLDIWCFLIEQGYAGNRFPPSPGSGGGNKLTDDYCLYRPSVTPIYLPWEAKEFASCWGRKIAETCGPAFLGCAPTLFIGGEPYVVCLAGVCGMGIVTGAYNCYRSHQFIFILP